MLGWLGILAGSATWAKEKHQQNKPYYGTDRELFRNNPYWQKKKRGYDRLTKDLSNCVPVEERNRRRAL